MGPVSSLTSLETLDLSGTAITDAGLKRLKTLVNLRTLCLRYVAGLTHSGMVELEKALPKLKIVR
jgi:Leucine-rich repeat (LRR) protein